MATLGTWLYTAFQGRLQGQDRYGNRYYEARSARASSGKRKRWVLYKGMAEPTKVTPEWHGWLHYTTDVTPAPEGRPRYRWLKEPQPNLTGTPLAYLPSGHVNRGAERAPTVADYQAWKP